MWIKNKKLITELIKKNYEIDLNEIDRIDFIMKETECKSEEDWKKVLTYIKWYTKKSRETFPDWGDESSLDVYFRYLKAFKDIPNRQLFPQEDCYYLVEELSSIKKEKDLLERVLSNYHKRERYRQSW